MFKHGTNHTINYDDENCDHTRDCIAIIAGVQHTDRHMQVKQWGGSDPCGVNAYALHFTHIMCQLSGAVIVNGNGRCNFLAAYRWAYDSSQSAWSKGRQPPGTVLLS